MGNENILWKFELDQIIFLDFTGNLKYKEIRVSSAKLFGWVYNSLRDKFVIKINFSAVWIEY